MNLIRIGGVLVAESLCMRVCMFTVSNALLMSSAIAIMRLGGFFLVEALCDCFVYVVKCCGCGMLCFETVLVCGGGQVF